MGRTLSPDDLELERLRACDVDARYAYTINTIRECGELWSLTSDGGWVLDSTADGSSAIAIWPHARLAELEATDAWTNATPKRIELAGWLTANHAAWMSDNSLRLTVFRAATSMMVTDYDAFVELLRGPRMGRYTTGPGASRAVERKRRTRTTHDLVEYIRQDEIDLVLARVPESLRERVGRVRRFICPDLAELGSVTTRGRRDIRLASDLPIRVSLGRYLRDGQSPDEFGAPARGQWPPWAIRRFLLYDVLLHELGHLQIVDPRASRVERKYASETRAQEFADELRRTLYSEPFDHPDPIHNAPSAEEMVTVHLWDRLDKQQRAVLVRLVLARDLDGLESLGPMTDAQRAFITQSAVLERRR